MDIKVRKMATITIILQFDQLSSPLCISLKHTLLFPGFHLGTQNSGLENMTLLINICEHIF